MRLYYCGGLASPENPNPTIIRVVERPVALPPIGGYLELNEWEVNTLLARYEGAQVFTLNEEQAAVYRDAHQKRQMVEQGEAVVMSNRVLTLEELEAEVARLKAVQEENKEVVSKASRKRKADAVSNPEVPEGILEVE